jgi:hypothetical protein
MFFQYLREQEGRESVEPVLGHRRFAMLMISTGLVLLPLATPQQLQFGKKLKRVYPEAGFPLATIVAAFISLLVILALIGVILRQ